MQIRIALARNPNSGKTTLFNTLTGSNQYVGNWPGVTVEKKEGKLKKYEDIILTDLPGVYSLSPYTLEEVVAGQTYTVSSAVKNIYGADLKEAEAVAPEQEELGYTLNMGAENTTAVITGSFKAPDATVIFVVYEGNNLNNVTVKNMSEIDTDTNSFTFDAVAEGQTCKLYIWDSLTGMKPLV